MYQEIHSDEQMSYFFSEETINRFRATIISESENVKFEEPKTAALGAFCLDEIQTNSGEIVNVFIEYNIFKEGVFLNVGFNKCCFWTGIMPDFVLDRFNELEKVINENN